MTTHKEIVLPQFSRGFHLITSRIITEIGKLPENGLLNVFIQHSSAALTINENADPSVRVDFEEAFNRIFKENEKFYTHDSEGSDDMPAHLKASTLGSSVTIPIINGQLALGTWQGIYLCEFRNFGGRRKLILSVMS